MVLQVVYVPGNTMLMDFPFQTYYQHLGHWLELAVPMYNVLRDGSWLEHTRSGSKVSAQPHSHDVGRIKRTDSHDVVDTKRHTFSRGGCAVL